MHVFRWLILLAAASAVLIPPVFADKKKCLGKIFLYSVRQGYLYLLPISLDGCEGVVLLEVVDEEGRALLEGDAALRVEALLVSPGAV